MQDPIHLCPKIRNRMLSQTASVSIGRGKVSIEVLMEFIQNKSKPTRGLVKTDIEPKDKQNFRSCPKISSDEVLTAFEGIDGSLFSCVEFGGRGWKRSTRQIFADFDR